MPVTEIRDHANFKELIENNEVVIIDAWADWCGPCKAIGPIFHHLSELPEFNKRGVIFSRLDVDINEDVAKELGVQSMPAFFSFHNGGRYGTMVGPDRSKLEQLVKQATSLI